MSSLVARKVGGLDQKLAALNAEFDEWLSLTAPGQELEKHHTQVRALVGHLRGLRNATTRAFREAKKHDVLSEANNLEALLLGIRRIWEFFRSKLVQRRDPAMAKFLSLADELAWAGYKPVLDVAGAAPRREPPLVFLNGGLSPFALARGDSFSAEAVPGEALVGRTWERVLRRLPIPVIGVPWHQTSHLPDLPVVAHETGHAVEEDFRLYDGVRRNIESGLAVAGSAHASHWLAWSEEVFADLWGCLTVGPAYVGSLMDFLVSDPRAVQNEVISERSEYPSVYLRVELCLEALSRFLGFDAAAAEARQAWDAQYRRDAMSKLCRQFCREVPAIVQAILLSEMDIGGKAWSLARIPRLRFTAADLRFATSAVDEYLRGKAPASADTPTRLIAAARLLFDRNPEEYVEKGLGKELSAHIGAVVRPGVRATERSRGEAGLESLSEDSRAAGEAWFADFANWAGVAISERPE